MSKAVSIEEPFQLSSYNSSYRRKQKYTALGHVFVNSANLPLRTKKEGLVTITAQADGIHLVDVSSLHSVVSHTLGPSTSFSCPAITIESEEESNEYTTYAVIETSTDLLTPEDAGRVVWKWRDNLSSMSVSSENQKHARVIVPSRERVHSIYAVPELSSRILGVSQSGSILLLDSTSLGEKACLSLWSDQPISVFRTFVFASSTCTFGSKGTNATVVVASFDNPGSLNIHVVSIDSNDELLLTSQFNLSQNRKGICDISCSDTGAFSVLLSDGAWSSYIISASYLRPLARPFKLASLAASSHSAISLIALTSHHILLAALSSLPSSSVIHIQVWDLQYSVLLFSHALPTPPEFSSLPFTLKLVPLNEGTQQKSDSVRGQAILILSSPKSACSSLLVVPYLVPLHSTLSVALGRGPASKLWIQSIECAEKKKTKADAVLESVKSAMEGGNVKVAEDAFSACLKDAEAALDYNFVKELLEILLPQKATTVYANGVVKSLLERRGAVSSAMVEGGLLRTLRERNDWESIEMCFSSVVDLPESDIIQTLVALTRQGGGDAMQVDTAVPSLPAFLSLCVNYPGTTSKGLVLGLKQWVRDPQDAAAIAQVLEGWIRASGQQRKVNGEVGLMPTNKELEKNEHGVWVVNAQKRGKKGKALLPPFVKVIDFLQSFMDACFLQLLQHAPSHKLLQQLQLHLIEEATFSDVLEQLRGSLEPFAVGHEKSVKEAAIPEKEKERQRQKGDWRQRRHGAPAVVGAVGVIGAYQVEEFVL